MLRPHKFNDVKKGINKILEFIEKNREDQKFEEKVELKGRKKTWFLDTAEHALYRKNNFILRIRRANGTNKYDATLKCRHPDRYISASYDLWTAKNELESKFEEDISAPCINNESKIKDISLPFISNFSLSVSFEEVNMPDFRNIKDLTQAFPNLIINDIFETESLSVVNNFEPGELTYKIGKLELDNGKDLKVYLNLWYLGDTISNIDPLIVELTFNYDSKDQSEKKVALLEEFPLKVVRKAHGFYYRLLQNEGDGD